MFEKFLTQNPPRKEGKLKKHRGQILALHARGYSTRQIVSFLESECGVSVSPAGIHKFLEREKNMAQPQAAKRIGVLNYSGNIGKTTLASNLGLKLNADIVSIETINSDDNLGWKISGRETHDLVEFLMTAQKTVVVDIGSSNIEEAIGRMITARAMPEFDLILVPTTPDPKVQQDTVKTLTKLAAAGVPKDKVVVVLNKVEDPKRLKTAFAVVLGFIESEECARVCSAIMLENEGLTMLKTMGKVAHEIATDGIDYRQKVRESSDPEERASLAKLVIAKNLAMNASENIDAVIADVLGE